MRQASRKFEWLMPFVMLVGLPAADVSAAGKAAPVPVEITVQFPGGARTTANVYARELGSGTLATGRVPAGEPRFTFRLAAGRYWFFAEPDDPGVPDLLGAHTAWSLCRTKLADDVAGCNDHVLAEVIVDRKAVTGIMIDDWYLPADIVRQLDESLHRNPDRPDDLELGAPRFSEYPARVPAPAAAFRFDATSHPEAGHWETAVAVAAEHGVNFAGHWLVVANACGEKCSSYALVDWSTGRIFVPDALRVVSGALPCDRTQPVQHRADSRLITVTQPENRSVVTRYFLWDDSMGSLTEIASYRVSAVRYCERD